MSDLVARTGRLQQSEDPLINLIADGRVRTRPLAHYSTATVLTIDLDILCTVLRTRLHAALVYHAPLRHQYQGTETVVTTALTTDINQMIDFAMLICYNRLRIVAERYNYNARTTCLNPRAPVNNRLEFSAYLSSLLSSIGPLQIEHGPLIIYATTAATMNSYGRTAPQVPSEGNYARFTAACGACNIGLAPLDLNNLIGFYWTTCIVDESINFTLSIYGTVHTSHYENEDVARAIFLGARSSLQNPFEDVTITLGYVNNPAVLDALAAVVPDQNLADSAGCPVGGNYKVNFYGIQPAVAGTEASQNTTRECYNLGRGANRIFTCQLADELSEVDRLAIIRHGELEFL